MKAFRIFLLILIIIGLALIFTQKIWVPKLVDQILSSEKIPVVIPAVQPTNGSLVTYNNPDYGFTFSLPVDWKGYSIVQTTWHGTTHGATAGTYIPSSETGPTLSIRNPNWTPAVRYEDIPIFIFTIAQWNSYLAWNFSISAAPVLASELARNNKYVFALPSHWDFDVSKGYQEAENILNTKPLHPFNL